jgi:mycothiol synthase
MAEPAPATITVTAQPTPAEQHGILALLRRAAEVDGHQAVNEAGLLALRHPAELSASVAAGATTESDNSGSGGAVHALGHDPESGELVGCAQLIWEEASPVAAVVVDPGHRRRGIGSLLWQTLAAATSTTAAPLRVWAKADDPAAQALARRLGLRAIRTLLVLGRSLSGDLPPTDPPPGIVLRTFRRGTDVDGWLATNARAFATHPEQGSITRADLEQRMAEPWFDPEGLLLAVRHDTGEIVGFHWTKLESGSSTGEVYVIGVDPTAGVRGLGTALLGAGLRHLRDSGASDVDLYVEADNERALSLYRRYGFAPVSADVMYAAQSAATGSSG